MLEIRVGRAATAFVESPGRGRRGAERPPESARIGPLPDGREQASSSPFVAVRPPSNDRCVTPFARPRGRQPRPGGGPWNLTRVLPGRCLREGQCARVEQRTSIICTVQTWLGARGVGTQTREALRRRNERGQQDRHRSDVLALLPARVRPACASARHRVCRGELRHLRTVAATCGSAMNTGGNDPEVIAQSPVYGNPGRCRDAFVTCRRLGRTAVTLPPTGSARSAAS